MPPSAAHPKTIDLDGVVVIVGNYGSGKTEVAVNLALHHRRGGKDVQIADLDLINPYFRTREARVPLRKLGIEVVLPPERYLHADLPILSPAVAGMLRQTGRLTLLDVGGNDAGATVLASLSHVLRERRPQPARCSRLRCPFRRLPRHPTRTPAPAPPHQPAPLAPTRQRRLHRRHQPNNCRSQGLAQPIWPVRRAAASPISAAPIEQCSPPGAQITQETAIRFPATSHPGSACSA